MSDYRHCDGPNCEKMWPLKDPFLDHWTTLDRGERFQHIGGRDSEQHLHFHSQLCLTEWVKENTRV